jgi:hypothetical protein
METIYQLPTKFCSKLKRKAFWAKVFVDQATSGLSAKKFCTLHQLPYSTYKGSKYRIGRKARTQRSDTAATKNKISDIQQDNCTTKFLPLQITANSTASQDACPAVIDQYKPVTTIDNTILEIQIIFKNKHRLILPATTPEAQLLSIINAVAGLLC